MLWAGSLKTDTHTHPSPFPLWTGILSGTKKFCCTLSHSCSRIGYHFSLLSELHTHTNGDTHTRTHSLSSLGPQHTYCQLGAGALAPSTFWNSLCTRRFPSAARLGASVAYTSTVCPMCSGVSAPQVHTDWTPTHCVHTSLPPGTFPLGPSLLSRIIPMGLGVPPGRTAFRELWGSRRQRPLRFQTSSGLAGLGASSNPGDMSDFNPELGSALRRRRGQGRWRVGSGAGPRAELRTPKAVDKAARTPRPA